MGRLSWSRALVRALGTPATFLPFEAGQPDGGNGENLRATNNLLEDRTCTDMRDYVCECK